LWEIDGKTSRITILVIIYLNIRNRSTSQATTENKLDFSHWVPSNCPRFQKLRLQQFLSIYHKVMDLHFKKIHKEKKHIHTCDYSLKLANFKDANLKCFVLHPLRFVSFIGRPSGASQKSSAQTTRLLVVNAHNEIKGPTM